MQVQSRVFMIVATLALLTACGEREQQEAETTAPPSDTATAENADAPGKTTTFEEPSPEPQQ
jgi:hypothetical protein